METRSCRQCGAKFEVPYPSSNRTNCSAKCRGVKSKTRADKGTRKSQWVTVICENCKQPFEVVPNRVTSSRKRGGKLYCQERCLAFHQAQGYLSGSGRPPVEGKTMKDGYIQIYIPPDERPVGWTKPRYPEHRWVMRKLLGRELLPGENVHHKNGIKTDNCPENLQLWVEHQPKGQDVHDLIAWAREILARYEQVEDVVT